MAAKTYYLAIVLRSVEIYNIGIPVPPYAAYFWGVEDLETCYENGGSVPCPCWTGRRSCRCP